VIRTRNRSQLLQVLNCAKLFLHGFDQQLLNVLDRAAFPNNGNLECWRSEPLGTTGD
jgi:hypothetical protein